MTFKEKYRDYQELTREHDLLRKHNSSFKQGDNQSNLLLFAESSLIIIMLERFLRMLPELKATNKETLYPLFKRAIDEKILDFPDQVRESMINTRNAILHGTLSRQQSKLALIAKKNISKLNSLRKLKNSIQHSIGL